MVLQWNGGRRGEAARLLKRLCFNGFDTIRGTFENFAEASESLRRRSDVDHKIRNRHAGLCGHCQHRRPQLCGILVENAFHDGQHGTLFVVSSEKTTVDVAGLEVTWS